MTPPAGRRGGLRGLEPSVRPQPPPAPVIRGGRAAAPSAVAGEAAEAPRPAASPEVPSHSHCRPESRWAADGARRLPGSGLRAWPRPSCPQLPLVESGAELCGQPCWATGSGSASCMFWRRPRKVALPPEPPRARLGSAWTGPGSSVMWGAKRKGAPPGQRRTGARSLGRGRCGRVSRALLGKSTRMPAAGGGASLPHNRQRYRHSPLFGNQAVPSGA